jgi:hypothetical protein
MEISLSRKQGRVFQNYFFDLRLNIVKSRKDRTFIRQYSYREVLQELKQLGDEITSLLFLCLFVLLECLISKIVLLIFGTLSVAR